MEVILTILGIMLLGIIVGALARLALPGPDPMSLLETMLVGIGGALLAGLVTWVLLGRSAGILLSIIGAMVIVYLVRRSRGGSLTSPGRYG